MKIRNLSKGEAYQLDPDAQLTVERTNPFFNEYGEQTVPLDIPASDHNLRLLDFPTVFGSRTKTEKADCVISDGSYHAQCRQAILGIQRHGSISTAFYMNDGSLYSRLNDIRLKSIFEGQYVRDTGGNVISTVADGIAFCRTLLYNTNPDYAIFPVLLTDDSGLSSGFNFKVLNLYGHDPSPMEASNQGDGFIAGDVASGNDFWGAVSRTEYVNEAAITLSPGYYISPFIRANKVLRDLFSYFGYTLQENFFTQTEPFSKMVLVNNVIDTLVNGKIRVGDLVPDVTAKAMLDVFRKKFCCEFVADEEHRTVSIQFLRDIADATPVADLTDCMTEEPAMTFNTEYKRITIGSEETVDGEVSDTYEDLKQMQQAAPMSYFDPYTGQFYKIGFYAAVMRIDIIGNSGQPYNMGGTLEAEEIKVPDLFPEIRRLKCFDATESDLYWNRDTYLYVGDYITLNSKMIINSGSSEDSENAGKQSPVLALPYIRTGTTAMALGTVSNYSNDATPERLWDYSLLYNGDDGIFERFWKYADRLYRNSLNNVKVKLLLSQEQKQNLPACAKISIRSTDFIFNKLKFTLGGKNDPVESEMKTIRIMLPEDVAPSMDDVLPMRTNPYIWEGHYEREEVTQEQYENSGADKDREFNVIYPPIPTEAGLTTPVETSYTHGQQARWINLHTDVIYYEDVYYRTRVWLESVSR